MNRVSILFRHYVLIVLSISIAVALIKFGAAGVRGTDQYWYIADVERIVEGEPLVTNNFFPGVILRGAAVPEENFIMHNSPMLYLVSAVSSVWNVYNSWIGLNVIFHLIVAACILHVCLRFTNSQIAVLAASFYLISPLAIWQAINPLLEMYFSALTAIVLVCYFNRSISLVRLLLYCFLGLGLLSHPIFVAPAFVCVIFDYFTSPRTRLSAVGCVSVVLTYVYLLKMNDLWFPSSFQPNLKAIIASVVPGKSNMFWHYSELLPSIDFELLITKFIFAVDQHLFTIRFMPFYMFTNLAIAGLLFLSVCHFKKWYMVLLPILLFFSQYGAMIVLQQNHPRYQQIIISGVFLLIAIVAYQFRDKWVSKKILWVCLISLWGLLSTTSGYIVSVAREESFYEQAQIEYLEGRFATLPIESRIVSLDLMPHNPLSYIARPREVLFLRTDMLDESGIARAIEIFKPEYFLVGGKDSEVGGLLLDTWESEMFGTISVFSAQ